MWSKNFFLTKKLVLVFTSRIASQTFWDEFWGSKSFESESKDYKNSSGTNKEI